jgi:hypothetical protein
MIMISDLRTYGLTDLRISIHVLPDSVLSTFGLSTF